MPRLVISTVNVRGLVESTSRKLTFSTFREEKCDIICIQEAHCTVNNVNAITNDWKGESVCCFTDSPFSRGVCILFKEGVDIKIINKHVSDDGRMVIVNVLYDNDPITLFNVYAPNSDSSRCVFFKKIKVWVKRYCPNIEQLILVGDMNCCLREIDRSSKTHMKDASRNILNNTIKCLDLIDVWHHFYPDKSGYTWGNKNGSIRSRLDYIFAHHTLVGNVKNVVTKYIPNTDHRMLCATLYINNNNSGPGYWKLNSSLLEDKCYVEGINTIIHNVKSSSETIPSKRITWEILKIRIKEFSIQFAVNISKRKRYEFKELQDELSVLEEREHLTEREKQNMMDVKNRIHSLLKEKERGVIIRSRAQWLEHGEKATKFFYSLEKKRQSHNIIRELLIENNVKINDDENILNNICEFYENLYSTRNPDENKMDSYLNDITISKILTDTQKTFCDQPLDISEFDVIIDKLKPDKSPGDDGLTNNFYKAFWNELKDVYFPMIEECFHLGELSQSMKRAIVALLFKKGDLCLLKNYRPISLTNTDYKLLAFVLSERLQHVIHTIIGDDQTAYIRKRFIGSSARTIIDIIDYCTKFNEQGLLLCLDFEKAFDSLEWGFLLKVLNKFNFGDNFIKWVTILYKSPVMMFKNNGWLSKKIFPSRGIRQGCPISALLFIIAVEIMAIKIRNSHDISGVNINGSVLKLKQYADDTTLILKNIESVERAIHCIDEFGHVAGLVLNKSKTEGILLGSLVNKDESEYINGISFTNDSVRCLGVYIGHDEHKCFDLNWTKKLKFFEQTLERWKHRNLTLFGRILILKTLALSKFVYLFCVISVPDSVKKALNGMMYKFIWNGKDKISRKVITASYEKGGLHMVDLDAFIMSLNASWAARILSGKGAENVFLKYYANKLGLTTNQLFLSNVKSLVNNKTFSNIPKFYQDVVFSFNKSKFSKCMMKMNYYDFLSQPLFYNDIFIWKSNVLTFKNWCECGIFFVCDLFDCSGKMITCETLFAKLIRKTNYISEYSIVKKIVCERASSLNIDTRNAKFINTKNIKPNCISTVNGTVDISAKRSNFFYTLLMNQSYQKPNSEIFWRREYNLPIVKWQHIYMRRVKNVSDKKIAEFNFKIIHRILPCGVYLSKWKENVSGRCAYCGMLETTEHLIFACSRVKKIWKIVSKIYKVEICMKHIILGFAFYDLVDLEYCLSVISYFIYKTWLVISLKGENNYQRCDLQNAVKNELFWKIETLKTTKNVKYGNKLLKIYNGL